MARINILHMRIAVSAGEFASFVTPDAVCAVISRYGFRYLRDGLDGATIYHHPDDNHGGDYIVVPSVPELDWRLRLDEAICSAAHVAGRTELEVFRDLLQESGHKVVLEDLQADD